MEPFTLSTERLILDQLRTDDAQAVFDYCQDPDFEKYLTIPWPYRIGDARYFITEYVPAGWTAGNELSWAVRLPSGKLLGVVSLRTKFGRYDIGFWLGAEHRGHGYMPEAVRALLDWAFDSGTAEEIGWECVAGNLASAAVARKLGFTFSGIRPSVLPARDGSHPESWHGALRASDDRDVKPGWPLTETSKTPPFSVVLFDLDDTLFDHRRAVGLGITAKRHAHGGPLGAADDAAEMRRWNQLEELHYPRYLQGELDLQGQRRVRVREFLHPYGIELVEDAEADAWYADYLNNYDRSWLLHEDALPCLDELEATIPGVQFGIITNAELSYQTPKLDTLGLSPRMRHIVASGEVGAPKPDARIFHHACELFAVEPRNAVYIGDRLLTDAQGANDAGLTGVWLDRGLFTPDAEELAAARASGVLVIRSLSELAGVLKE